MLRVTLLMLATLDLALAVPIDINPKTLQTDNVTAQDDEWRHTHAT